MKATTSSPTSLIVLWFMIAASAPRYSVGAFFARRSRDYNCPRPTNSAPASTKPTRLFATDPDSLLSVMSAAVSKSLERPVELEPTFGGGAAGGGGASVSAAKDKVRGDKYFIKTAPLARGGGKMLRAEYLGIKEMADTKTIKVPEPIAYGEGGPLNTAFVVFEYLDMMGGRGAAFELGVQLAKMHKSTSPNGQHGFHVDNTIGATPQPNTWVDNWADFWDEYRLGHMLKLTRNLGYGEDKVAHLRQKTRELLNHDPTPSLLHGDLWGGNKGYAQVGGETVPVIFDPATYYGCREADLAMTGLFGGFSSDFYEGYNSEFPLPDAEAYSKRKVVYNLYHIMNHYVLFGGMYAGQAKGMIEQILRM